MAEASSRAVPEEGFCSGVKYGICKVLVPIVFSKRGLLSRLTPLAAKFVRGFEASSGSRAGSEERGDMIFVCCCCCCGCCCCCWFVKERWFREYERED